MIGAERDAIERTRRSLLQRFADASHLSALRDEARGAGAPRAPLSEALSSDRLALIVEPKRAMPSRGVMNPDLDIAEVARTCAAGGATALSIVTDELLSAGTLDDLRHARAACDLPLIARDFALHPGRIFELRATGADAVMIPVGAFLDLGDDEPSLDELIAAADVVLLDVVLSVSDEEQLALALETEAETINIDNRGDDGRIDVERTFELLNDVPAGKNVISESVARADEVARLHRAGVDGLLLDEGHVDGDLAQALEAFRELTLDEVYEP